jgi:hypothetical protein
VNLLLVVIWAVKASELTGAFFHPLNAGYEHQLWRVEAGSKVFQPGPRKWPKLYAGCGKIVSAIDSEVFSPGQAIAMGLSFQGFEPAAGGDEVWAAEP